MAITSHGYGEAKLDEPDWARLAGIAGSPYSYSTASAAAPYVVSGLTLGLMDGAVFGWGVLDDLNGVTYTLTGAAAWWCVCLRRSWGAAGRKTEVVAHMTAAAGVPASRESRPGAVDDQPVAFVQTSGTGIVSVIDARQHASKAYHVADIRAVFNPQLGATYTTDSGLTYTTSLTGAGTVQLDRAGAGKAPAFGQATVQFSSTGEGVITHNLGYKPTFFHVQWEANDKTEPLIIVPQYTTQYPSAITATEFRVFARYLLTVGTRPAGTPYAGPLSHLNWVAYGGN